MSEKAATTCAVGSRDGRVILEFPEAVQWAAFDPDTAKGIGTAMLQHAYNTKYPDSNVDARKQLSQQLVVKLQTRLTHVIRSLQDKGKQPEYIANEVVNIILSEVY